MILVGPAIEETVARLGPGVRPPVQHHLDGGGKRVRAALVLLAAVAAGGAEEDGLPGAVAIELVHNFSLLHDDIIDEDTERRHRPTAWARYGLGQAVVGGDALALAALELLLADPTPPRVRAAAVLAQATQAMIAGQADDMAFESRLTVTVEECLQMEEAKTGALLACAASLGAILAGAPPATVQALADFGSHLGIAFQAVDDILGVWGEPAVTGKPVGSDLLRRKKTLPVATALGRSGDQADELRSILQGDLADGDVARATELLESCGARHDVMVFADTHLDMALQALRRVPLVQGPADELAALARFVTARDR
ncbi:MAG TPA: polyprenyl synthetase family protein [Acidimicrobiales bacterium]|nr:polyprenyl synthetase family protein [Acidimicrobiales bacterium]